MLENKFFFDLRQFAAPSNRLSFATDNKLHVRELIRCGSQPLRESSSRRIKFEDLALKDVETWLSNWLVKRCPNPKSPEPVTIELSITKRVLAAELGTVSETLSRTLAKLREQKLLIVTGKKITILSPSKLNALLRSHLGEPDA